MVYKAIVELSSQLEEMRISKSRNLLITPSREGKLSHALMVPKIGLNLEPKPLSKQMKKLSSSMGFLAL